jgi:predicted nucleic acid-binding protein
VSVLYYLDASAWVRRYFAEAGSAWMRTLFQREVTLASTPLGYIEVVATLARRSRPGASLPALQTQLRTEWEDMLQFEISTTVYDRALWMALDQKLRGADAIHLAAAQQLRDQTAARHSLDFVLVTSDGDLLQAARNLQLAVTNPRNSPEPC